MDCPRKLILRDCARGDHSRFNVFVKLPVVAILKKEYGTHEQIKLGL